MSPQKAQTSSDVIHTPLYDIIESQHQQHTRRHLFAAFFSPHLMSNFIRPTDFVIFDVKGTYQYDQNISTSSSVFFIPLEGEYHCTLNGRSVTVGTGEGLLVQSKDSHVDDCHGPCRFLTVNFQVTDFLGLEYHGALLKKPNTIQNHIFRYKSGSDIDRLIHFIEEQSSSCEERLFIKQTASSLAQTLIWYFLDLLNKQLTEEFMKLVSNNLFQFQLNQLFQDNIHCQLSTDDMAKAMKISKKSLELKCSKLFGKPPAKAFHSVKMEMAGKLLKSGKSSKDVTEILGINNQFHFSRTFKAYFGMTASEYCAKW